MILPKSIKIGGHIIDIVEKNHKEGFDKSGEKKGWLNKIFIQQDMPISKKMSVLIHEIIHEIEWQNNLDLTEGQVASLAEGLFQVIIDNYLILNLKEDK